MFYHLDLSVLADILRRYNKIYYSISNIKRIEKTKGLIFNLIFNLKKLITKKLELTILIEKRGLKMNKTHLCALFVLVTIGEYSCDTCIGQFLIVYQSALMD